MGIELTEAQRTAVYDRGGSLLVSAAAGSGKTKVLVERLFAYMTEEGCQVDDFLIITYTKAAAAELRGKIAAELSRRVADDPNAEHLRRQMFRVYQADIKTVDAFCAGLLRENAHLLPSVKEHSLTPDFRVLDEQEALLLKQRVLERTMEDFYADMDDCSEQLAETLGAGRDDRALESLVLELHNKIQSHPYPLQWLEDVQKSWENIPDDLSSSAFGRVIMDDTVRKAEFWTQQLTKTAQSIEGDETLYAAYADRLLEVAEELRRYVPAAKEGWDAMARIQPAFRRMGAVRGDSPEKERVQAVVKRCREALKKMTAAFETPVQALAEDLRTMAPAMLALIRLTADFAGRYQAEKVRRNAMDFSDQEHYAIDILLDGDGQPTELACQIAGRYREVMVDEYQDSNAVQDCIFRAVSREGGNLFTVGDVKQSIYRFRLADPTIFLTKYLHYRDAAEAAEGEPRRVLLSRNFRSRQAVLDSTNFVFRNIMSPEMGEMAYGVEEQLYFGAEYYVPREDCDTEFHLISVQDTEDEQFDRTEMEANFVARRVRRLLDEGYPVQNGDGTLRPCRAEDIVILMRSPRTRLKAFTAALERENIPCSSAESEDFFATVEVASMVSFLQIIDNPRQDVPLISVLRSPLFGYTPDRLAAVRALQAGDYYDALRRDESADSRAFLALLEELRQYAAEESADKLLWHIYDRCHAMAVFGAMPGGEERKTNLIALYDYARQTAQSGRRSLFDFNTQLHRLLENEKAPALSTKQAAGGVQIMSVHTSKGLEFPIVILCDLSKKFNRTDVQPPVLVHPKLGLGTECVDRERHIRYDTVSKTAVAMQLDRESKAEEMRILYVAMTRAKEKLITVCCMKKPQKHIRDLISMTACPVPPEAVSSAYCMGDWILLPLLCAQEAAPIWYWADMVPEETAPSDGGWSVHLWENPTYTEESADAAEETDFAAEEQHFDPTPLEQTYAYPVAVGIPSKVTATQLKGRELDSEVSEGTPSYIRAGAFKKPRFLQERTGLSAAEKGTAMHLMMQYIDFAMSPTEEAIGRAVEALCHRRLLTSEQAQAVDRSMIAAFLVSPICQRIREAEKVWREYRFNLLLDASLYDTRAAGEEMMLQGVVDCAFDTQEGLVIVDFKTDRIRPGQEPERAENYRTQLDAYATALSRVLERPVAEKILYFFHTNSYINL